MSSGARLACRNVEPASGGTVRQEVQLIQSIDQDTVRKIVKFLKNSKYKKVQTQIQGAQIRVSGKSKDDLQTAMRAVKEKDFGIALQFTNYRP